MLSEVLKTYTTFSAMILYGLDKGIFNGTIVFGNEKKPQKQMIKLEMKKQYS